MFYGVRILLWSLDILINNNNRFCLRALQIDLQICKTRFGTRHDNALCPFTPLFFTKPAMDRIVNVHNKGRPTHKPVRQRRKLYPDFNDPMRMRDEADEGHGATYHFGFVAKPLSLYYVLDREAPLPTCPSIWALFISKLVYTWCVVLNIREAAGS